MANEEGETPNILSGSLQSITHSWVRAASLSKSPLVLYDQQTSLGSSWVQRRPSLSSRSSTTFVETLSSSERSQPNVLTKPWSSNLDNVHSRDLMSCTVVPRLSIDDRQSCLAEADEHTALLQKLSSDVAEQYVHRSTFAQTVFNTVNLIFGVGLFGLPLAIKYAGLLLGLVIFTMSALTTLWTARMVEKCLSYDNNIRSFGDLAFAAYGSKARIVVTVLLVIELTVASISQIVLFASGAQALFAGSNDITWKILSGVAFIPLSWVPLRYLGVSSALSVFCFFSVAGIMVIVGLVRPTAPGSLRSPESISVLPQMWTIIPASIGMIMSTWGGHTVFPEFYHDMKKPEEFFQSVKTSYSIASPLYLLVGVLGYLMFGNKIAGPITSEMISLDHLPSFIPLIVMGLVTFIPVAKIPLNIHPISSAIEQFYILHTNGTSTEKPVVPKAPGLYGKLIRRAIRTGLGICFIALSILFPKLDKIMSLLGIVAGLLISVVLPICFYLSIMPDEVSRGERWLCMFAVAVGSVLTVVCLVFTMFDF